MNARHRIDALPDLPPFPSLEIKCLQRLKRGEDAVVCGTVTPPTLYEVVTIMLTHGAWEPGPQMWIDPMFQQVPIPNDSRPPAKRRRRSSTRASNVTEANPPFVPSCAPVIIPPPVSFLPIAPPESELPFVEQVRAIEPTMMIDPPSSVQEPPAMVVPQSPVQFDTAVDVVIAPSAVFTAPVATPAPVPFTTPVAASAPVSSPSSTVPMLPPPLTIEDTIKKYEEHASAYSRFANHSRSSVMCEHRRGCIEALETLARLLQLTDETMQSKIAGCRQWHAQDVAWSTGYISITTAFRLLVQAAKRASVCSLIVNRLIEAQTHVQTVRSSVKK